MELSLDQFAEATGATHANASEYLDAALAAMARFNIATEEQIAAFLASVSVETQRLTAMEENLYYTHADRLADLFRRVFDEDHDGKISPEEVVKAMPYLKNPTGLSMRLYGGFNGRGGSMLTWERNYRLHGDKLGVNYVANPGLLLKPEHAMLSAASFYDEIKGNECADDMGELTRRWNGPRRLALAERIAQKNAAMTALA